MTGQIGISLPTLLLLAPLVINALAKVCCNGYESDIEVSGICNPIDRQALKYFQMEIMFAGEEFGSWQDDTDCCHSWKGVFCNRDGRVGSLNIMDSREISEPRPKLGDDPYIVGAGLGDLADLQELTMRNIAYNGQIPPAWGGMKNLKVLSLEGCNVVGHIPNELCKLTHLRTLILKGNLLTGPVPACFLSPAKPSNLTLLDLLDNELSGQVPSIPCSYSDAETCKFFIQPAERSP